VAFELNESKLQAKLKILTILAAPKVVTGVEEYESNEP